MAAASLGNELRRPIGGKSQKVAYTGTAGSTNALPESTAAVAVYITTAGYVAISIGTSATAATTADIPLPANTMVILPVEKPTSPGLDGKIFVSAIQDAAGGNLFVQPLAD